MCQREDGALIVSMKNGTETLFENPDLLREVFYAEMSMAQLVLTPVKSAL